MNKAKSEKTQIVALLVIIAVQILMLVYVGFQKQEYHIDEIYSYILSNSYDVDRISNADWMWNNWISGRDFHDFVTVQEGERFAYDTVYRNNSLDCHPPLFYWLLHTVCSFTPDTFSKWSGLLMNIVLFVAAAFLIYFISDALLQSVKWKLLPVILWGFSAFAVDTCSFIRMYMLLTVITLCFTYLHVRMFFRGVTIGRMILIWLTIYLGAMTQYYSAIFSFWGVLIFSLYLLKRKEVKNMLAYGFGACASIGAMFLSYPYVFTQALGSTTNNVGNEVVENFFNFKLWILQSLRLAYSLLKDVSYQWQISLFMSLVVVCVVALVLLRNRRRSIISIVSGEVKTATLWIIYGGGVIIL